jgi:hypothetical protein
MSTELYQRHETVESARSSCTGVRDQHAQQLRARGSDASSPSSCGDTDRAASVAARGTSQWGRVKQLPSLRTITRRSDEPKLEIGDKIPMEEGVVGLVLARYTRAGDLRQEVYYIVKLRREAKER